MNGVTLHGIQSTEQALNELPTSYFHPSGPAGQLLGVFGGGFERVAVIGLGAFWPLQELAIDEDDVAVEIAGGSAGTDDSEISAITTVPAP